MKPHRPGPTPGPSGIHAPFRRRVVGLLARLEGGGGQRTDLAVAVAPPRPGMDCDLVVSLALECGGPPPEGVLHRLAGEAEREADVASVAAAGPGVLRVTLTAAARASAFAALLRRGLPGPAGRTAGAAFADAVARCRDGTSLADARAAALADLFAGLDPAGSGRPGGCPIGSVRILAGRGGAAGSGGGLREALDAVGPDALRFALAAARPGAPLSLDLDGLAERSRDNPLFWIRYVRARAGATLRDGAAGPGIVSGVSAAVLARLRAPGEVAAVRAVLHHEHLVARCATIRSAHGVAAHLSSLATMVHDVWNSGKDQPQLRFVNEEQRDLAEARFVLVTACTLVLSSGLGIFGVSAPGEML